MVGGTFFHLTSQQKRVIVCTLIERLLRVYERPGHLKKGNLLSSVADVAICHVTGEKIVLREAQVVSSAPCDDRDIYHLTRKLRSGFWI